MLWYPDSEAMQRAADRKALSAQEAEEALALHTIDFGSFIESPLIFDITDCWVNDETFLPNVWCCTPVVA